MNNRNTIKLNFNRAKQQADRLEEIGNEIKRMANRDYEDTLNGISVAWKGENANAYLSKARVLQNNIAGTGDDLIAVANEIRRKAQRVYNAEMEALKIAEQREFFGTFGGGGAGGGGGGGR